MLLRNCIITFLLVLSCGISAQNQTSAPKNAKEQSARSFNPMNKIGMVATAISRLYVDVIDEDTIAEKAIIAMLKQLDPHSTYLPPREAQQTLEALSGKFDGIGVQISMVDDTLYVSQVIVGGPSEKAGLMAGDRIVAVDDSIVAGRHKSSAEIITMLRGKRGTKVNIAIARRGTPDLLHFTITRDKIPVHSIDAEYMLDDTTGYIRLSRFAESSADEIKKAIKSLQKEGMKNLVLDLQGNGGGYLNVAVEIADMFLDDNQLIVYTEGRNTRRAEEKATGKTLFPDGRLVILVDETSASASEILAGAIQDWDRGVIVGRRTFGKGLVQRPFNLPDKSLLRLTIARYHTPTGRCIQRPYVNGEDEEYENDLVERLHNGELQYADSTHFADSLQYRTLRNNRVVYGGGGIMPDCFVGLDTTIYTPYHRSLLRQGILNRGIYAYLDAHRKEVSSKYKKVSKFIERYEADAHLLAQVDTLAARAGIFPASKEEREKSQPLIALQLKALLARDLFDASTYYMIYNPTNDIYRKAIDIVNSQTYDQLLGNP